MIHHLRANVWLLGLTLLICAGLYPALLWGIGQTLLSHEAEGSLVDGSGRPTTSASAAVGSRLIAQPFRGDEYFQPRPSAASYNAAASAASNWGASNYLLRDRVARQLGPIVKYRSGPRRGQPVGPDIEAWFQKDRLGGRPALVAQWAQAHPTLASNWVKADPLHTAYVAAWRATQPTAPAQAAGSDPAVEFFASYSARRPGTFPGIVERQTAEGKTQKRIEPVQQGSEIQGIFFDLWLEEHAEADLEPVPADMVMASGSGLDPHITLANALYQLERVAGKWSEQTGRDATALHGEIEAILRARTNAPLGGLAGPELVNVLEVNLALRRAGLLWAHGSRAP